MLRKRDAGLTVSWQIMRIPSTVSSRPFRLMSTGLLEAALARPQASVLGEDAYPDLHAKAAALLHSLARNHALTGGNKRLAFAATIAFLGSNGQRLTLTNDQAYELVMAVATGEMDGVPEIVIVLR